MALAVLLGLYPIVMLLTLYFPGPYTVSWAWRRRCCSAIAQRFDSAVGRDACLEPDACRVAGGRPKREPRVFYGGAVGIVTALVAICAAFRAVSKLTPIHP